MDKATQVRFQALIDTLSLSIRLWVVSGTHGQCDLCQSKQLAPKRACENGVPIRYDVSGHTMKPEDVIQECLSNLLGREWMVKRHKMCEFAEFIHDHHDAIGMSSGWEAIYKIHGHHLPSLF
jgi:hypothetical protein